MKSAARLLVLCILLAAFSIPSIAQEETPEAECDYSRMVETFEFAAENIETSDDPFLMLRQVQFDISMFQAECSGLSFSSEIEGLQPVIGPVEIPEGVYRAIATTEGFMSASVEVIEGECEGRSFGSLFNLFQDQATEGAEALFISEGCTAFIEISNTTEPWTLVFEKV
jgi:hypothetical protein